MEIIKEYPPNYALICMTLKPDKQAIFAYGNKIYNPSGREVTPDIEHHEEVHMRQQGDNPDAWYARYVSDPDFRLSQELEAYGEQYLFAKDHIERAAAQADAEGKVLAAGRTQLLEWARDKMAEALSGESYGNLISYGEADSKLRHYTKNSELNN